MRAAYLVAPYRFERREVPAPTPGKAEVLVRVTAAGVCGSDLHFYSAGRIGEVVLDQPFVMGHEFCGVVEDAGEFSASFPKGTRVAAEPSIACGTCFYCREDRPNLCLNLTFIGFPPKGGGYAEFITLPGENLRCLPDSIPDPQGPLVETLAVAIHTVELMGDVRGKSVAILGAGPVGLLTFLFLRYCGATVAYMTEPIESRREFAQFLGMPTVLQPDDFQSIAEQERELDGVGPEFVVEAAGEPASYSQAMQFVRRGGTVIYCGIYPYGAMSVDFTPARRKELRMVFVRRSLPRNYSEAIRLVASGEIDLAPFCRAVYPFDRVATAFEDAWKRVPGLVKAILHPVG